MKIKIIICLLTTSIILNTSDSKLKGVSKKNKPLLSKFTLEQKEDIYLTLKEIVQKLDEIDSTIQYIQKGIFIKSQSSKACKKHSA